MERVIHWEKPINNERFKKKEKIIQKQVLEWLRYHGWLVLRMPPSIYSNMKGLPDAVVIKKGRHVWIEFKSTKGKISPAQEELHNRMREFGAEIIVIREFDESFLKEKFLGKNNVHNRA